MRTVSVLTHHDSHPLIILLGSYSHALTCKQGLLGRSSKQKNPSGPITATRQKGRSNEDEDVDSLLAYFFPFYFANSLYPLQPATICARKTENCWARWSLFISPCPIYCPFWVGAAQINPFITRAAWNSCCCCWGWWYRALAASWRK